MPTALHQFCERCELDVLHASDELVAVANPHEDLAAGNLSIEKVRKHSVDCLLIDHSVGIHHAHDGVGGVYAATRYPIDEASKPVIECCPFAVTCLGQGPLRQHHPIVLSLSNHVRRRIVGTIVDDNDQSPMDSKQAVERLTDHPLFVETRDNEDRSEVVGSTRRYRGMVPT